MGPSVRTPLFLIGARGSGKSTVGRILADRLGWPFLDLDERIEATAGLSVTAIFNTEGEQGFRERETCALAEASVLGTYVIATGGGIVLRPANRELLRSSGHVFWLTASPEACWDRIQADPISASRRPNLTKSGGIHEVRELLRAREPLYLETAHYVIPGAGRSPEQVADDILIAWSGGSTSRPQPGVSGSSSSD